MTLPKVENRFLYKSRSPTNLSMTPSTNHEKTNTLSKKLFSQISPDESQSTTLLDNNIYQISSSEKVIPNLPGMSNLLFAPGDFIENVTKTNLCHKIGDTESKNDATLKALQAPFSFTNALTSCITNINRYGPSLKPTIYIAPLSFIIASKLSIFFGIIATAFESIIEFIRIKRIIGFSKKPIITISSFFEKINQGHSLKEKEKSIHLLKSYLEKNKINLIRKLEKKHFNNLYYSTKFLLNDIKNNTYSEKKTDYFLADQMLLLLENFKNTQLIPKENNINKIMIKNKKLTHDQAKEIAKKIKLNELTKRIGPLGATYTNEKIDQIIKNLKSFNLRNKKNEFQNALKLIQMVKTQQRKNLLIHSIGMVAITITMAALLLTLAHIFSLILLPGILYYLPNILAGIGFILGITKFVLNKGLMNNEGWKFTWNSVIPEMPWKSKKKSPLPMSTKTKSKPN